MLAPSAIREGLDSRRLSVLRSSVSTVGTGARGAPDGTGSAPIRSGAVGSGISARICEGIRPFRQSQQLPDEVADALCPTISHIAPLQKVTE